MNSIHPTNVRAAALLGCLAITFAMSAQASRVTAGAPSGPPAVQTAPTQPPQAQSDESASLRQGVITAIDESRGRIQVQGMWLDVASDATTLFRSGRSAGLQTLKVGESIRFAMAANASGKRTIRLIYAP